MKKVFCIGLIVSTLSACAGYRPIIDPKGVDMNAYETDLRECQDIAKQIEPGTEAAGGALIGVAVGAALGVAVGGRSMAGYGAGIGGVQGAAAGGLGAAAGQAQTIKYCLLGRGYRVLR